MDDETTPADLARELGVDPKTIRDWLRDEYGTLPPTVTRWRLTNPQAAYVRHTQKPRGGCRQPQGTPSTRATDAARHGIWAVPYPEEIHSNGASLMNPSEILAAASAAVGVTNVRPLTQGGQKWVFEATLVGNPVVLKIVPVLAGPSASIVVERAHREVELLAAVDSPHVVTVLSDAIEIGERPEAVVWLEEKLDGADLSAGDPPQWNDAETLRFIREIASGLGACHSLAVVHRDLSPGNVRKTSSGRYVLMDPGLARHLEKLPLTGVFQPGTKGFRSPEHVPGGNPTPASDVFGLGILAYYFRSGAFPVDSSGTDAEYDRRLRQEQAPDIESLEAGVDPKLAYIINRCLQRQPARRFINGHELLNYIDRATGEGS